MIVAVVGSLSEVESTFDPEALQQLYLSLADALRKIDVESVLLPMLIQMVVIIVAARLFAIVFRRMGQPSVVGEIVAGLMLGPSFLGWIWPEAHRALFHPSVEGVPPQLFDVVLHWNFVVLSQLGLIFLLFLVGLEFDFNHLRWNGKSAVAISVTGVAIPFGFGLALAPLLLPYLERHELSDHPVPAFNFALFLGTALSITAIPVLARMMLEWNITRTRLGTITISAAAVDDATGWILLAAVAAAARAEMGGPDFRWSSLLLMIAETMGFALFMILIARPVLQRGVRWAMRHGDLGVNALTAVFVVVLLCSVATNLIGIFAVFGAFFLGAVLSSEKEFREAISSRVRDFVTVLLLPIFFAWTGLRTDVRALGSPMLWCLCGLVVAAAVIGKLLGCALAARLSGLTTRESGLVGVMMNTRGLMALVVVNLGYEMRVIPKSVFCMLVIMAVVTTFMTSPLLLRLMRDTELEAWILRSGFLISKRPNSSLQSVAVVSARAGESRESIQ
jgi:Kef-type K+ transport system membrane component KefB